ncbi:MAG: hypothetical protein LW853_06270, partial [Rickettsiales bacterium]|nr:hypothetical protein [Rickettsiales bacterium]
NINLANVAAYRANAQLCATRMDVKNPSIFKLMMELPDQCTEYLTSRHADLGVQLPGVALAPNQSQITQHITGITQVSNGPAGRV